MGDVPSPLPVWPNAWLSDFLMRLSISVCILYNVLLYSSICFACSVCCLDPFAFLYPPVVYASNLITAKHPRAWSNDMFFFQNHLLLQKVTCFLIHCPSTSVILKAGFGFLFQNKRWLSSHPPYPFGRDQNPNVCLDHSLTILLAKNWTICSQGQVVTWSHFPAGPSSVTSPSSLMAILGGETPQYSDASKHQNGVSWWVTLW